MATKAPSLRMDKHSFYDQPAIGKKPKRTIINRDNNRLTTFNTGELIIIDADLIQPNDTINLKITNLVRQSTLKVPVMDEAWLNKWVFFVPFRLVFNETEEFFGQNNVDEWTNTDRPNLPMLHWNLGDEKVNLSDDTGKLLRHLGIKIPLIEGYNNIGGGIETDICELYLRAYKLIYNQYFLDQNHQKPLQINRSRNGQPVSSFKLQRVNKIHDYFTSTLPAPQKGDPITIGLSGTAPLINAAMGEAEIVPIISNYDLEEDTSWRALYSEIGSNEGDGRVGMYEEPKSENPDYIGKTGIRGIVDLSKATAITINQLREAFALQRILELDARNGTRYTEYIEAHFGIHSPDSRLQRAELLGSAEERLTNQQVNNTAGNGNNQENKQGWLTAFGQTISQSKGIEKTFTEHGILLTLAAIRTERTYQQGLERHLSIKTITDLYDPQFDGIGEQVVKNREIYANGSQKDNEAFGFQEYAAHYRYKQNTVAGMFESGAPEGSLDFWHYADDYNTTPIFDDEWIKEPITNVDRTLAVTSQLADQWIAKFIFEKEMTRPMPLYSIPGEGMKL